VLVRALEVLSHSDVMQAAESDGILYTEDRSDLDLLRAWARTLRHPALPLLTTRLFWRKSVGETRSGGMGVPARDHFAALRMVRPGMRGLELLDRDGNANLPESEITGVGLQRVRWRRYEIESYLVHPATLDRFVEAQIGRGPASSAQRTEMATYADSIFHREFVHDPLAPNALVDAYLTVRKARTDVLPPILNRGGLPNFPHTRYHEIAGMMLPSEIHPEVVEKLDAICRAFGVPV
jgi:hypothetical protein